MYTTILHRLVLFLLLATVFSAGGCALIHAPVKMPEPVCVPEPVSISENVQLVIYRHIAALVAENMRAGDQHVRQGELYEAVASYKAAFAYDDHQEGLQAKIVALEDKVTKESARLYERGRSYLATDKERALQAFNAAIRINPAHAEARAAYDQLRRDPAIKAKLAGLEAQIQQESAAYAAKPAELQSLITKNEALLSYDYSNQTALSLAPWLDKEKGEQVARYLGDSEKFFVAGKLVRTKALLKKAQLLAPDNDQIRALLKKVQRRQDVSYLLKLSRDQMQQHDLPQAIIYAGRILQLDVKNQEARDILNEALQVRLAKPPTTLMPMGEQREFTNALVTIRQLCLAEKNDEGAERLARSIEKSLQREVLMLLERGQALYAKKAYADAQTIFEYVEEVDPDNEQAQTFTRKIENRLETIESLQ